MKRIKQQSNEPTFEVNESILNSYLMTYRKIYSMLQSIEAEYGTLYQYSKELMKKPFKIQWFFITCGWCFIIEKTFDDEEMAQLVETVKKFQLESNLIGKWNTGSTLGSTLNLIPYLIANNFISMAILPAAKSRIRLR